MKLSVLKDGGNEPLSEIAKDLENERKHEAAWRANQLEIVGAITIPLVLANLINASVVWLSFHDTSAGMYLSIWISGIAIICAAAVLANKVRRFRHRGLATSRRLLKEYTVAAAIVHCADRAGIGRGNAVSAKSEIPLRIDTDAGLCRRSYPRDPVVTSPVCAAERE